MNLYGHSQGSLNPLVTSASIHNRLKVEFLKLKVEIVQELILDCFQEYSFQKGTALDLILFCGSPGCGKSTYYWQVLKPLGYERVNQDILKSVRAAPLDCLGCWLTLLQRNRCLDVAQQTITAGQPVVIGMQSEFVSSRTLLY
jgi:hypothetical protein